MPGKVQRPSYRQSLVNPWARRGFSKEGLGEESELFGPCVRGSIGESLVIAVWHFNEWVPLPLPLGFRVVPSSEWHFLLRCLGATQHCAWFASCVRYIMGEFPIGCLHLLYVSIRHQGITVYHIPGWDGHSWSYSGCYQIIS